MGGGGVGLVGVGVGVVCVCVVVFGGVGGVGWGIARPDRPGCTLDKHVSLLNG